MSVVKTDLVDPYLTEKTRRSVAKACGCSPVAGQVRTLFFRKLTVGQMLQRIPTYESFCTLAYKEGTLGAGALGKIRKIYE